MSNLAAILSDYLMFGTEGHLKTAQTPAAAPDRAATSTTAIHHRPTLVRGRRAYRVKTERVSCRGQYVTGRPRPAAGGGGRCQGTRRLPRHSVPPPEGRHGPGRLGSRAGRDSFSSWEVTRSAGVTRVAGVTRSAGVIREAGR